LLNAVLAFIFGLSFLLIPHTFVAIYGLTLDPDGTVLTRSLGGVLLGLGFIVSIVSKCRDTYALLGLVIGGLILHSVTGITDYFAVRNGIIDPIGMSIVVLHAVLTIGFIYFLVRPKYKVK
jgi:hypothetical protein